VVQGARTGHTPQIALAFISLRSRSSFRSKVEGGKKRYAWLPRHSASSCQSSRLDKLTPPCLATTGPNLLRAKAGSKEETGKR